MNILITGIAGFLGSHLADACLAQGHAVTGIDDLSGGAITNVPNKTFFVRGDITEEYAVKRLFAHHRFDVVLHCAAYAAEGLSHHIRLHNYRVNLLGSATLLNAALNQRPPSPHFVFLSSAAVYGCSAEDGVVAPIDPYGVAKYATELDIHTAHSYFGLPFSIYRLHNVYGPRQNLSDRYRNVVGIFVRQALSGTPFTVFGNGTQARCFTYVSDVVDCITSHLSKPTHTVYTIGNPCAVSVNELARAVASACGVPFVCEHAPARKEAHRVEPAHTSAEIEINYQTRVSLEEGIAQTVAWARTQTLREPKRFERIEVERNLPKVWA